MPSKKLLVFCDGTGQDGLIVPNGPTELLHSLQPRSLFNDGVIQTMQVNSASTRYVTNVLRLSRAVRPYSEDGTMRQIVFYQNGVGSEADFNGDDIIEDTSIQLLGTAVASKIRDAYAFIAQNFEEGDEIFLFGFSRGAYTARKLSELIDKIGLLETESLGRFFNIWKDLVDGITPPVARPTRIRCVAVWDTVGSVFNTIDALHLKDSNLPPSIDVALHAVSLQEDRQEFLPTLWTVPTNGLGSNQILKETWFPGAHADVGGGYPRHELADIALFWMTGEIIEMSLFNLDSDFITRSKQTQPDDWGTSQPHNSYEEMPFLMKAVISLKNRLDGGVITPGIIFHQSCSVSPTTLTDPYGMVTLEILQQRFGSSWKPTYAPLNKFEQDCKAHWKSQLPQDEPPIIYDDVSQLFPRAHRVLSEALKAPETQINNRTDVAEPED